MNRLYTHCWRVFGGTKRRMTRRTMMHTHSYLSNCESHFVLDFGVHISCLPGYWHHTDRDCINNFWLLKRSKWSSDRSKGLQSETANSNLFRSVQARLISSLAFLLLQCSAQLLTPMISCILQQLTRNSRLLLLLLFLLLFFFFLAFRILTVPYLYLHILNSILGFKNASKNVLHFVSAGQPQQPLQLRNDFLRLTTHSGGWDCSSIGINQQICLLLREMQLATGNLQNRRIIQW